MTEARWARITELFHRATEMAAGPDRDAWLNATCASDSTLRRHVQRLLDAHAEPSLESPASRLDSAALELASGEQLAHYQVQAKIGQGGMGVVYRAFDTKLRRLVALKVLPPYFAANEDRRKRLLHEARAASLLNHPNVVTIHEIGIDQDLDFIAMEYIDGDALQQRIPEHGMPVPALVAYALQIAGALATAHAARVLHRDIKPSNIMVTRDDRVKVLDFGLARLLDPDEPGGPSQTLSGQEVIRGTPAYMSPEQASGHKLDVRSDVFSFGCVLYQMATGRRPFEGDSHISVMYGIVNQAARSPAEIVALPPGVEALILRCLEKEPDRRFQTMEEVRSALLALDPSAPARRTNPVARHRTRRALIASLATVLLVVSSFAAWRFLRGLIPQAPRRTVKFAITPSNLLRGGTGEVDSEVSVSRDGKLIAYVESQGGRLWVRDIGQERAQSVPGTADVYQVFWSPDNRWIGYSSGKSCGVRPGCDLMKIPAGGGRPRSIVRMAGSFKRASWSSDGKTIVYCDSLGMYTVPAEGGEPKRIVQHTHIEHPSILDLPGNRRAFLFQALDAEQPSHAIYIHVDGEKQRRLVKVSQSTNPYPAWSSTGHIVYVDGPNARPSIWALPFSLETLRPTGEAFRIVDSGSAPMLSATGTMVYGDPPSNRFQLTWVDRSGKALSTIGEPIMQAQPLLSPDARRAVIVSRDPGWDLAVHDVEGGNTTPFTSDPRMESLGGWSSLGITYASNTTAESRIVSQQPDSNTEPRIWLQDRARLGNPEWSPDGLFLMYTSLDRNNGSDILHRERLASAELGGEKVFLRSPAHETVPRWSPSGRFIAYVSDESGQLDVHIRDGAATARNCSSPRAAN